MPRSAYLCWGLCSPCQSLPEASAFPCEMAQQFSRPRIAGGFNKLVCRLSWHSTGSITWRPVLSLHPEQGRASSHFPQGGTITPVSQMEAERRYVAAQQARPRPAEMALSQAWAPKRDLQPLTQDPTTLHTGSPTEHEGEEGVVTQQ